MEAIEGVADRLFEAPPERVRAAVARGDLALRTRDATPSGFALFDETVGIGGDDDQTGPMTVFVDTDDDLARERGDRVYRSVRADSEPLSPPASED